MAKDSGQRWQRAHFSSRTNLNLLFCLYPKKKDIQKVLLVCLQQNERKKTKDYENEAPY